jgi:putative ABC transport system permease protein
LRLRILRGSLLERRGRVTLAVLAIAIGTSVAAALLLVSRDVGAKVQKELRAYGPNAMLVPASGALTVGANDFAVGAVGEAAAFGAPTRAWLEAERAAGRASAFATLSYRAASREGHAFPLAVTEPAEMRTLYPAWRVEGASTDVLVGERLARKLGVAPGADLAIEVARGAEKLPLVLHHVAVVSTGAGEDDALFVSPRVVGDAGFQLALVRLEGASKRVIARDAETVPGGAQIRVIKQLSAADGDVLKRLARLLGTVTAVALLAALLCAMSTLADLVLERTREVALLRSLGAGRRDVLALFAGEAVVIGLIGGAIGLGIGVVAAQAIGHGVFGTSIALAPIALPVTLGLGVATALLASLVPVRHALAIEPAPVLRGE